MSDSTTLGLASTAVGLVNSTIGLLKEARDGAKRSHDHDLKDKLSEVYDAVLELKELISNLRDENAALQKQLQTRSALKWNTERKLYFAEGDPDPFCPTCLETKSQQIRLQPVHSTSRTVFRYDCKACHSFFPVNR